MKIIRLYKATDLLPECILQPKYNQIHVAVDSVGPQMYKQKYLQCNG